MKPFPSAEKFTAPPTATSPLPTSAPVRLWVVEMGNPRRVARITVRAAPSATASRKGAEPTMASGTSPLPENFFNNAWARKIAVIDPAKVMAVAQAMAVR